MPWVCGVMLLMAIESACIPLPSEVIMPFAGYLAFKGQLTFFGLGAGNPVGQAAWILERFHDWSDLRTKSLDEVYSKDQLITNLMLYVMTGSFTTGAWYYRGFLEEGGVSLKDGERCETPTAFANFPGEALYAAPPQSWVKRAYNLTRWTDMATGGHFAAMEEPALFLADVQAWGNEALAGT